MGSVGMLGVTNSLSRLLKSDESGLLLGVKPIPVRLDSLCEPVTMRVIFAMKYVPNLCHAPRPYANVCHGSSLTALTLAGTVSSHLRFANGDVPVPTCPRVRCRLRRAVAHSVATILQGSPKRARSIARGSAR